MRVKTEQITKTNSSTPTEQKNTKQTGQTKSKKVSHIQQTTYATPKYCLFYQNVTPPYVDEKKKKRVKTELLLEMNLIYQNEQLKPDRAKEYETNWANVVGKGITHSTDYVCNTKVLPLAQNVTPTCVDEKPT